MCPIAPIGAVQAFPLLTLPGQAGHQFMNLQPVPANKAPMLMHSIPPPPMCPAPVALPPQRLPPQPLLPASIAVAPQRQPALMPAPQRQPQRQPPQPLLPVSAAADFSDDESDDVTSSPAALSRAARRRMRQRANKKRGKAEAALALQMQKAAEVASDESTTATDDEMFFTEVVLDLPTLPPKAVSRAKPAEIPAVPIMEIGGVSVKDVPIFPVGSLGGMKSVPVCAYQAVQRLEESPEILMEDAVVIQSCGKLEFPVPVSAGERQQQHKVAALPFAELEELPVVRTFIHFGTSARSFGSSHRSRSSSF